MIHRNHGKVEFECEACGEVLETGTSDFEEAREVLRAERWRIRKLGAEWVHICPTCPAP